MQSHTSSRREVESVRELDIAQVAQRAGVTASTLRFHEEKGLDIAAAAAVRKRSKKRASNP